ncbi:E3 SUMO-protein ligase RanBP2 isoform X2 [Cephus cinctus]|uniref:E3 SUMO-protein ligase RanBP2 isoform X2 n=1 Tax=Cephus cinctus TaxID=211228 RepID=A0AAJ7BZU9_CEPCN|nr:E3 SUMO-protein ligase RanBP2 isoform X2 [Cephus cinctus]
MFRKKTQVDRHVQDVLQKLKTEDEKKLRHYNFAKLYYQVGEYESARKYVSSYLEVRENVPGAYKLLGQTLEALGQKEAALAQYKASLELEPKQDNLVLKVCDLLGDMNIEMDVGMARYWVERADRLFPHHPLVFQLKEKLLTIDGSNEDSDDLESLIASELSARPTDVNLRVKLLRYYMEKNRLEDAYKHASAVEALHAHRDNVDWYQMLCELFGKCKRLKSRDSSFWILYLSSLERYAALALNEQGDGIRTTVPVAAMAVLNFDQMLTEAKQRNLPGNHTFTESMFTHMWGQLHFHLASLLLRKTKREQGSWAEAGRLCAPLLFIALHVTPLDITAPWATQLKDICKTQVQLWYKEGHYRCSQAGHVLHDYARNDTKRLLDKIDRFCSGAWRERVYHRIFESRMQQNMVKTSYFATHIAPSPPLRLCSYSELKRYDEVAEEVWPASLHHHVWLGLRSRPHYSHNNSKENSSIHPHQYCHVFPDLQFSVYNLQKAAAESLSRLDIDAFLNAAVLCASVVVEEQQRSGFLSPDKLPTLPADITSTLCTNAQEKWWSSAYKMYREQDAGEIRQIIQQGLEVVRCIGSHGLHSTILVHLARIFGHRVKVMKGKNADDGNIAALEARCELYWSAAVPLLERLQNNQIIRTSSSKLFDYQGKEMNNAELTNALEEGRLLLVQKYIREKEYEQAIEALRILKCPDASFQQGQIYKKLADDLVSSQPPESLTSEMRSQHSIMLIKARDCFYLTLDRLRSPGSDPKHRLNSELSTYISTIENELKRIDPDLWRGDLRNECESDESYSSAHSVADQPVTNNSLIGLGSSVHILCTPQRSAHRTPKQSSTPCKPQHQDILELSRNRTEARPSPERLDAQIRQLISSKESSIQASVDQNKALVELLNAVLESSNALKQQVEELKKEVVELRKENTQKQHIQSTVSQNLDEELFALGEEDYGDLNYGVNASAQSGGPAPAFPANVFAQSQRHPVYSPMVYPSTAALQGYYQGGLPFNDPTTQHMAPLYPPVYSMTTLYPRPTVEQSIGVLPKIPESVIQQGFFGGGARLPNQMPEIVPLAVSQPVQMPPQQKVEIPKNEIVIKDAPVNKVPPVNVVITTSDTLPTTAPSIQPTLSVTIPAHHRLGGSTSKANANPTNVPHSYQISMPSHANIPTTVNLPPLSATLTITTSANMSVSEKASRQDTIVSTGSANNSSEWVGEVEHDPIPDFQPVIPLPAEVEVTTGEEGETTLYCARAKLFRFVDKEWKERGVGDVKLLKNNEGKVRLLMRRDQVLKICANHMLRPDMELSKMPSSDKAWIWVANDYADEEIRLEKLCIKFKTEEESLNFKEHFDKARLSLPSDSATPTKIVSEVESTAGTTQPQITATNTKSTATIKSPVTVGGFSFVSQPIIQPPKETDSAKAQQTPVEPTKVSPFLGFSFIKSDSAKPLSIWTEKKTQDTTTSASAAATSLMQPTAFSFVKTTATPAPINFSFKNLAASESSASTTTVASVPVTVAATVTAPQPGPTLGAIQPTTYSTGNSSSNPSPSFHTRISLRRPHAPAPAELAAAAAGGAGKKDDTRTSDNRPTTEDGPSEPVEDFVPTAEFAPVIPLPDIVEVVTGEEGETVLFEQRAKLLRFNSETKEWKERGIGKMKILLHVDSGKIRLLMRREQVLKVCCNHTLLANMKFTFMPNSNTSISWYAQDYSEGEVKGEAFAIRFKTDEQASEFHKTITSNQQKMINDRIPVVDSGNQQIKTKEKIKQSETRVSQSTGNDVKLAGKEKEQKSLSEMFKPSAGSWECSSCYTRNNSDQTKCVACEGPSPNAKFTSDSTKAPSDWECKNCYTKNFSSHSKCESCNAPSPLGTVIQSQAPSSQVPLSQIFKQPAGSWECKTCCIVNSSSNSYCAACDTPKDPQMPPKPKAFGGFNLSTTSSTASAFTFGIPASNGSQPITFGISKTEAKVGADSSKPIMIPSAFGTGNKPDDSGRKFVFGIPKKADTPTDPEVPFVFGSPGKSFDFHFQAKSPVKSPGGGETSEDEVTESDDVYFPPVIPLPDKVDVKTGEENEEVLYSHRAKLFRFDDSAKEWKERGLGDIKLLKHKETEKLRLVMRRDQVLKLCLNHFVPENLELTPKDDKTWLWYAADFSEGEIEREKFACRFKTAEIAQEFKKTVDEAISSAGTPNAKTAQKPKVKSPESIKKNLFKDDSTPTDVEIVYESKVTAEEKSAALKLKLPENFYAYLQKEDCPGCIGCREPQIPLFADAARESTLPEKISSPFTTGQLFGSSTTLFGQSTPQSLEANLERTKISTTTATTSVITSTFTTFGDKSSGNLFGGSATTVSTSPAMLSFGHGFTSSQSEPFKPNVTTSSDNLQADDSSSAATMPFKTDLSSPMFAEKNTTIYPFESTVNDSTSASSITTTTPHTGSVPFTTNALVSTTQCDPAKSSSDLFKICSPSSTGTTVNQPAGATLFGETTLFGNLRTPQQVFGSSATPVFGASSTTNIFGGNTAASNTKSIFDGSSKTNQSATTTSGIFDSSQTAQPNTLSNIFGGATKTTVTSNTSTSTPFFGGANKTSFFEGPSKIFETQVTKSNIFGYGTHSLPSFSSVAAKPSPIFGGQSTVTPVANTTSSTTSVFDGTSTNFASKLAFGNGTTATTTSLFGSTISTATVSSTVPVEQISQDEVKKEANLPSFLQADNTVTFSALAAKSPGTPAFKSDPNFSFAGAGSSVFGAKTTAATTPTVKQPQSKGKKSEKKADDEDEEQDENDNEQEHDPHFEPIIPLPDAIEVYTGEEDEEKVFCSRAKLYRYATETREWKERGVGEMKVLYHRQKGTYRLLLRREQVHKTVCNFRLTSDIQFKPLSTSRNSWIWAGINYADSSNPTAENLAVKFKTDELAKQFKDVVDSAQEDLRSKEQQSKGNKERTDEEKEADIWHEDTNEEDDDDEEDEDDFEEDPFTTFRKSVTLLAQDERSKAWNVVARGMLNLAYDGETSNFRIIIKSTETGDLVSNTLITVDSTMQVHENICTWSTVDYALQPSTRRNLKLVFSSERSALSMHHRFEQSLKYIQENDNEELQLSE